MSEAQIAPFHPDDEDELFRAFWFEPTVSVQVARVADRCAERPTTPAAG